MLARETGSATCETHARTRRPTPSTFVARQLGSRTSRELASWLDPVLMRGRKAERARASGCGAVTELAARSGRQARGPTSSAHRTAHRRVPRRGATGHPRAELPPGEPRARRSGGRHRGAPELGGERTWAVVLLAATSRIRAERTRLLPNRGHARARFGSWNAALEAAGLAERAASTAEVRARVGRRRRAVARLTPRPSASGCSRRSGTASTSRRQPADRDGVLPLAARGGAGHADAGDRVSPLPRRLASRARGL